MKKNYCNQNENKNKFLFSVRFLNINELDFEFFFFFVSFGNGIMDVKRSQTHTTHFLLFGFVDIVNR